MSLIVQPRDLNWNVPIACLIYGQPGCGKTSLAISSEKPLLIDLDNGLLRIPPNRHCPSVPVSNYQQVLDVLNSDEIDEFQTIVIDTFGKLILAIGDYVCEKNPKYKQSDGTLSQKGWGAVKIQAKNLIKLLFAKKKNIIFVAHEKEDKDGDEKFMRPNIPGSAGQDLIQDLDLMGYMQMVGNKRIISFSPTHKFYAKNSLELPPVIEIPDNRLKNDFYSTTIIGAVQKRRDEIKSTRLEYDKLVAKHALNIDMIKGVEDFNIAYNAMKEDATIWDSTLLWKKALKEKADAMNISFNTATGVFEKC